MSDSNKSFRRYISKKQDFKVGGLCIGNIIDVAVLGAPGVLRTAVIFFYLSNEGVSLLENAAHLGLPVPEAIKTVLEQLHDKSEKGE